MMYQHVGTYRWVSAMELRLSCTNPSICLQLIKNDPLSAVNFHPGIYAYVYVYMIYAMEQAFF